MSYAIISDIHSNLNALNRVMERIGDKNIDKIYCLGDIVGYGPEPRKCLEIISKECSMVVKGNHDEATLVAPFGFNALAKKAIEWSKIQLDPNKNPGDEQVALLWKYLEELPIRHQEKDSDTLYVHASPREPITEYVLEKDLHSSPGGKLDQIFDSFEGTVFVGHSHVPGIFFEKHRYISPIPEEGIQLPKDEKCLINVGSVGQPRDYDHRACWVEVDEDQIIYHRVPYDVNGTYEQILSIEILNSYLGVRLKVGM